MRNSYRRWIRNSKLVCVKENRRVIDQRESLAAVMTFLWEVKHKSCVVFIMYLSSALTQHSVYKRHNGCFQVDLISVSPCVPVQIVNEGLWDDRPDSFKYLHSDLSGHRFFKPRASFRPPGIVSSRRQSAGSAAWPPELSCARLAPGKQRP